MTAQEGPSVHWPLLSKSATWVVVGKWWVSIFLISSTLATWRSTVGRAPSFPSFLAHFLSSFFPFFPPSLPPSLFPSVEYALAPLISFTSGGMVASDNYKVVICRQRVNAPPARQDLVPNTRKVSSFPQGLWLSPLLLLKYYLIFKNCVQLIHLFRVSFYQMHIFANCAFEQCDFVKGSNMETALTWRQGWLQMSSVILWAHWRGAWLAACTSILSSSPSWWEAPGRCLWAHFWIDFLSACGYKEAPGDKLFDVNPSRPDKPANPASWVSTSKFLMIVNHLLTEWKWSHCRSLLESDRSTWDLHSGFLPELICCKNMVQ